MKLFIVSVETEMAVYAEDAAKAEDLARRHQRDVDAWEFSHHAVPITDLRLVDSDLADSPPYGSYDDKTVRELFEAAAKEIPHAG